MKSEAQRRAFVAEPRLELIEIYDRALVEPHSIEHDELEADIGRGRKRYSAEHGRTGRRRPAAAHA